MKSTNELVGIATSRLKKCRKTTEPAIGTTNTKPRISAA